MGGLGAAPQDGHGRLVRPGVEDAAAGAFGFAANGTSDVASTDAASAGLQELAANLDRKGAVVLRTGDEGAFGLPVLPADHPGTDAACLVQSFYGFLARLARRRGADIRAPRHLRKVTRTR